MHNEPLLRTGPQSMAVDGPGTLGSAKHGRPRRRRFRGLAPSILRGLSRSATGLRSEALRVTRAFVLPETWTKLHFETIGAVGLNYRAQIAGAEAVL